MNKFTLKQTGLIQNIMKEILTRGSFIYATYTGLCFEIKCIIEEADSKTYERYGWNSSTNAYYIIKSLMGNTQEDYISTEPGLSPERVMFLILCTTISAQDFNDWANAA